MLNSIAEDHDSDEEDAEIRIGTGYCNSRKMKEVALPEVETFKNHSPRCGQVNVIQSLIHCRRPFALSMHVQ